MNLVSSIQSTKVSELSEVCFVRSDGRLINADVNGSANIVKKAFPNAFAEGLQGQGVRPVRVTPYKMVVRGNCNICLENL